MGDSGVLLRRAAPSQVIPAGLDFGTTNSSLAIAAPGGEVKLARFPYSRGVTEAFRSLLYLERVREDARTTIRSWSGPVAIDHYLEATGEKGRLVQSLKSFLTSRSLKSTEVFGRQQTLENLIAIILRDIRLQAERQFGHSIRNIVAGRPVRFVGSSSAADDEFAEGRLRIALQSAGFEQVSFVLEPVGAAYHYESKLDHDELILIGDFGGGTSDFTVTRVGAGVRARGRLPSDLLANHGVGIAGDSFDARIVRHLVSPALGDGTNLHSIDKVLPVPSWVYRRLERWHHLSLLRGKETLDLLRSVQGQAFEPERIAALIYLVENDLGYRLHQSVQQVKCALSHRDEASFQFLDGDVFIETGVTRAQFESWIAEDIRAIEECVDQTLDLAGVDRGEIDRVFLTGGSSFVPAVRRIFETRFGASRIRHGDEFTSVASGLALSAIPG